MMPPLSAQVAVLAVLAVFVSLLPYRSEGGILAEPVQGHEQPSPNTVPAFPVQNAPPSCKLDLSAELFGGVAEACGRNLDRSRCCPVLAAWLFAAHARYALQVTPAAAPPSSAPEELPMVPDDSQKCVNALQSALISKSIHLPQPNATCDAVLCFCGIRLHQISSLSCPAAFNVSSGFHNATPTAAVRNLEKSCLNSSYAGCTRCVGAVDKLKGGYKNGTAAAPTSERTSKMLDRDCQLMGLTWLLARNKTAYIPTVSAALRAILYSAHPPRDTGIRCSPDQENMPLAVDSLQFERAQASSSPPMPISRVTPLQFIMPGAAMMAMMALGPLLLVV